MWMLLERVRFLDGIECDKIGVSYEAFLPWDLRFRGPRGVVCITSSRDFWHVRTSNLQLSCHAQPLYSMQAYYHMYTQKRILIFYLNQADQYEIENNLLPQYRVEGRFERINEHPGKFFVLVRCGNNLTAPKVSVGWRWVETSKKALGVRLKSIQLQIRPLKKDYLIHFTTGGRIDLVQGGEGGSMKKIGKKFSPIKHHHHHHRHHHHNHRHHGHRNHQDSGRDSTMHGKGILQTKNTGHLET
ncbi:hypothetical protein H6P81_006478 [Aristolochia fimbriata]|uniref:Uncharacterized protein n=1 Tax=Aristolochia fimbriata TaxID=158543 RepID=A0AAV7EYK7_ARIFI|nr:hypothetical protein H6P81_006478 [Aristolochia fimbriata]